MYCKNCGAEMIDGAPYCPNCGAKSEIPSANQPMPTPTAYANTPPTPTVYTAPSETSRPVSTPNPVAGFIFSIIGMVYIFTAWLFTLPGFYNNYTALISGVIGLITGVIGLIFGVISLILILTYMGKYHSLHGIGVVGLVFSCIAILFAVILIVAFVSVQNSSHNTANNLRELERLFDLDDYSDSNSYYYYYH